MIQALPERELTWNGVNAKKSVRHCRLLIENWEEHLSSSALAIEHK